MLTVLAAVAAGLVFGVLVASEENPECGGGNKSSADDLHEADEKFEELVEAVASRIRERR